MTARSSTAAPATCHSGRDINGATLDAYLGGVYSAQNVVGLPFSGTASIVGNAGNIQITGLPAYRPAVVPYAASGSNWLWNGTTCAATGKYITISGSTNYNGTYAITGCANGTANVAKAYVGDELAVSWAVFAAGTKNNHDIQSAARVYGGEAHVGYEYAGQSYAGLPDHNGDKASCMNCHSPILSRHTMEVEKTYDVGGCGGNGCHDSALHGGLAAAAPAVPYSTFQSPSRNLTTGLGYDNNAGTQTLGDELGSFADNLGVAAAKYFMAKGIKQAAKDPCWNLTTNVLRQANAGNVTAICDGTESTNWATTNAMDPKLIRAWYNMSFYTGDPGAWAHNFDYIAELMYDSARDLGGDAAVATLIRP